MKNDCICDELPIEKRLYEKRLYLWWMYGHFGIDHIGQKWRLGHILWNLLCYWQSFWSNNGQFGHTTFILIQTVILVRKNGHFGDPASTLGRQMCTFDRPPSSLSISRAKIKWRCENNEFIVLEMDERMHENEIHANTKRQNEGTWNWKWLLKFHSHARNWNNLFYSKKSQSQNYSKMDHLRHHSQKWVIIRDPQTELRTQKPSWIEHFEAGNITWKYTQPGYFQTQWLSWNHKLTRNHWY